MSRWRIFPVAGPEDSRWQGRRIWPELVVEAASSAEARRLAARQALAADLPPIGNETRASVTGFEDEKLYWVERLPD
jgi:hypothetical protein